MSRTRRGSKGPGYDYWSPRPFSDAPIGKFTKKRTNKAERKQADEDIEMGFREINANLREPCPCCHSYCGLDAWACEEEQMALKYFDQMGINHD